MWKQFVRGDKPDGAGYWEDHWGDHEKFQAALNFSEYEPITPSIHRHTREGDTILDGGFGLGQHCIYWRNQERAMVGLDYSMKTAQRVRTRDRTLQLAVGDVECLPFASESFDAYLSGGVLEHFELGPTKGLKEVHRVLKPGGKLIGWMPFLNYERRLRGLLKGSRIPSVERISASTASTGVEPQIDGWRFHQYLFTRPELENEIESAGFDIAELRPFSWQWGIYDSPMLHRSFVSLERRLRRPHRMSTTVSDEAPTTESTESTDATAPANGISERASSKQGLRGLLHRVGVSETSDSRLEKALIRVLQECFSHMCSFVATRT